MKLTYWFTHPTLSHLRIAIAGALVLTAVSMACIAAKTSSPSSAPRPHGFVFKKGDPDMMRPGGNKRAVFGGGNEFRATAYTPGVEAYLKRAYPDNKVSMQSTVNAQNGWVNLNSSQHSSGSWQLIGPSTANDPDVLTFSGVPYTTSGRITALAIAPTCHTNGCRLWVAAAGGGIWRTDNALAATPAWSFVSGSFATNAIGALTYDAAHNALYAGTGESNASGDSEAGLGIYRSTDGGSHWTHLASATMTPGYSGPAFDGRSISSIVIDPSDGSGNTLYVTSTLGVRGFSSVCCGGIEISSAPVVGLYKSTDGGANFTFQWDGGANAALCDTLAKQGAPPCSFFGAVHVELDPSNSSFVYAAAFQLGVWRSSDGGATFTQIKTPLNATDISDRAQFAVTRLPNGNTRMYVGDGSDIVAGRAQARFYRTDNAQTATNASFTDLTTSQNIGYCGNGVGGSQCSYDNFVVTPAGHPDQVYLGGCYSYDSYGGSTNGRGVLYSTNGGANWTDETWDATTNQTPPGSCCQHNPIAPNGIHPDQHALVVSPNNPGLFFDGSDGGLMRSSGSFADISPQCASRGLTGTDLTLCQQLLSRVPTQLYSQNKGLSTLQFQSLSVPAPGPHNNFNGNDDGEPQTKIQGGTQDNGTFQNTGSRDVWPQIIYGDGGQSGFSATNDRLRFNTFTGQANDVNFRDGDPLKWVIATGPIVSSPEGSYFYPPVTGDPHPANGSTIFQGSFSVWRTQDWAGNQAYLEANCPEFTTSSADPACGDFVIIGNGVPSTQLTSAAWGTRDGQAVAAIERYPNNAGTLWAATGTGRIFISDNGNDPASSVVWARIDNTAANSPQRFPTSIYVDPANPHHAWISYSGYIGTVPPTTGHVFDVTWSGAAATWTDISYNLPDLPVTDLVRDDVTGDLYAASDFGVMKLPNATTTWAVAGTGLPMVEVPGLTIVPRERRLYAATHGRSAWMLQLPEDDD